MEYLPPLAYMQLEIHSNMALRRWSNSMCMANIHFCTHCWHCIYLIRHAAAGRRIIINTVPLQLLPLPPPPPQGNTIKSHGWLTDAINGSPLQLMLVFYSIVLQGSFFRNKGDVDFHLVKCITMKMESNGNKGFIWTRTQLQRMLSKRKKNASEHVVSAFLSPHSKKSLRAHKWGIVYVHRWTPGLTCF